MKTLISFFIIKGESWNVWYHFCLPKKKKHVNHSTPSPLDNFVKNSWNFSHLRDTETVYQKLTNQLPLSSNPRRHTNWRHRKRRKICSVKKPSKISQPKNFFILKSSLKINFRLSFHFFGYFWWLIWRQLEEFLGGFFL